MFFDNDNVRCVGTRPVGSTMEFPLVMAAEDSSSGAFGGWRPGECGHGNWRMGVMFYHPVMFPKILDSRHVSVSHVSYFS